MMFRKTILTHPNHFVFDNSYRFNSAQFSTEMVVGMKESTTRKRLLYIPGESQSGKTTRIYHLFMDHDFRSEIFNALGTCAFIWCDCSSFTQDDDETVCCFESKLVSRFAYLTKRADELSLSKQLDILKSDLGMTSPVVILDSVRFNVKLLRRLNQLLQSMDIVFVVVMNYHDFRQVINVTDLNNNIQCPLPPCSEREMMELLAHLFKLSRKKYLTKDLVELAKRTELSPGKAKELVQGRVSLLSDVEKLTYEPSKSALNIVDE